MGLLQIQYGCVNDIYKLRIPYIGELMQVPPYIVVQRTCTLPSVSIIGETLQTSKLV